MRRTRILLSALIGLLSVPAVWVFDCPLAAGNEDVSASNGSGIFSVVETEGQHADILGADGKPRVRYVYQRDDSTKERAFDTAKVFAHVMAPGGEETLTSGPGGKLYPHHRGIFIGWNKIQHDGKSHDLWHVRDTVQQHKSLTHQRDAKSASITAEIQWIGKDGKPLIREKRTHRLVEDGHAYAVIDLTSELTAVAGDLVLDGDPEHAGIQFRPSQEVAENKSVKYTFHGEEVDPAKQTGLPWVACSFRIGGQDWTVQHISHPSNPSDARWSAYRDYGRFGEFPVIEIADGETRTLRYRFRITQGDTPGRQTLQQAAALFADR
jgi:hypothetical protein